MRGATSLGKLVTAIRVLNTYTKLLVKYYIDLIPLTSMLCLARQFVRATHAILHQKVCCKAVVIAWPHMRIHAFDYGVEFWSFLPRRYGVVPLH